jgi:4-hydroxybenzoyl-CoA thioesterase
MHGAILDFTITVRSIGRSSLDLGHAITSEGHHLWSAEQRLVATSLDTHRSCPWPDELRAALSRHLEPSVPA